ncbi:TPA: hypothetical protein ACKMOL_001101, partial [Neisseria gonorrhoeae]
LGASVSLHPQRFHRFCIPESALKHPRMATLSAPNRTVVQTRQASFRQARSPRPCLPTPICPAQ